MTTSEMEATPKQKVEGARFQPTVDIFETKDELRLLADMPGVPTDGVGVSLEGNELTIEGQVRREEDDGLKPLHVEYGVGGYYRRFTLGKAVDRDGIKAQMRNGVLTLRLPKTEAARVRRIEVQGD